MHLHQITPILIEHGPGYFKAGFHSQYLWPNEHQKLHYAYQNMWALFIIIQQQNDLLSGPSL